MHAEETEQAPSADTGGCLAETKNIVQYKRKSRPAGRNRPSAKNMSKDGKNQENAHVETIQDEPKGRECPATHNNNNGDKHRNGPSGNACEKETGPIKIDKKFFNYDNEERRLFGPSIDDSISTSRQKRNSKFSGPNSNMLVPSRPHLTSRQGLASGDLSMAIEGGSDGSTFSFAFGKKYAKIEREFFAVADSMSPDLLVDFNQRHPWHPTALYLMATMMRHQGDFVQALSLTGTFCFCNFYFPSASCLEAALVVLELCAHPRFRFGYSTIDYNKYENRLLFLSLLLLVDLVGRKGKFKLC